MRPKEHDQEYDLTGMIVGPLYFGMLVNIVLPAALLFLCWWVNNNYQPENRIPDLANTIFYVFIVISLLQAAAALWWRHKSFQKPMVRRIENLESDIKQALLQRSRSVFLLIASIALWGYVYFYLTGRFQESAVFVIFSFVVFQIIRPRYGSVKKLVGQQKKLAEQGKLLQDGSSIRPTS